jgi:hypothetical protein
MCRRPQVIGVVMTVNAVQHFEAHAQKSRRFPLVDAGARHPGVGGEPRGLTLGTQLVQGGKCDDVRLVQFNRPSQDRVDRRHHVAACLVSIERFPVSVGSMPEGEHRHNRCHARRSPSRE